MVMGKFLTLEAVGFFAAADPISRLPLMISISIATTILPASSEAFRAGNKVALEKYVSEAYKFSLLFAVPMCIGLACFAAPILRLLYFTNPAYVAGASALAILSIFETVPDTGECMLDDTNPLASAMRVPTFTVSPFLTMQLAGAPMCWLSIRETCRGTGMAVTGHCDVSLFSLGCIPPMRNVFNILQFPFWGLMFP